MKKIKGFNEFLLESYLLGSRAPLYHSTSIHSAIQILEDNTLKPSKTWKVISFTREKDFIYEDSSRLSHNIF